MLIWKFASFILSISVVSAVYQDRYLLKLIFKYIYANEGLCGDPFSNPQWLPAMENCTIECDPEVSVCLKNTLISLQMCRELPLICRSGIRESLGWSATTPTTKMTITYTTTKPTTQRRKTTPYTTNMNWTTESSTAGPTPPHNPPQLLIRNIPPENRHSRPPDRIDVLPPSSRPSMLNMRPSSNRIDSRTNSMQSGSNPIPTLSFTRGTTTTTPKTLGTWNNSKKWKLIDLQEPEGRRNVIENTSEQLTNPLEGTFHITTGFNHFGGNSIDDPSLRKHRDGSSPAFHAPDYPSTAEYRPQAEIYEQPDDLVFSNAMPPAIRPSSELKEYMNNQELIDADPYAASVLEPSSPPLISGNTADIVTRVEPSDIIKEPDFRPEIQDLTYTEIEEPQPPSPNYISTAERPGISDFKGHEASMPTLKMVQIPFHNKPPPANDHYKQTFEPDRNRDFDTDHEGVMPTKDEGFRSENIGNVDETPSIVENPTEWKPMPIRENDLSQIRPETGSKGGPKILIYPIPRKILNTPFAPHGEPYDVFEKMQKDRTEMRKSLEQSKVKEDQFLHCCEWALAGLCDRHWQKIRHHCPKSCGVLICEDIDGLKSCTRLLDVDPEECYQGLRTNRKHDTTESGGLKKKREDPRTGKKKEKKTKRRRMGASRRKTKKSRKVKRRRS